MPQADALMTAQRHVGADGVADTERVARAASPPFSVDIGEYDVEGIDARATVTEVIVHFKPDIAELISRGMAQGKHQRTRRTDAVGDSIDGVDDRLGVWPCGIAEGGEGAEKVVVTVSVMSADSASCRCQRQYSHCCEFIL